MEFKFNWFSEKVEAGVFPKIKFGVNITSRDPEKQQINARLLTMNSHLMYSGDFVGITDAVMTGEGLGENQTLSVREICVQFNRESLKAIESNRIDDIEFTLRLQFLYSYYNQSQPSVMQFSNYFEYHRFKFSQKEWTKILQQMGYYDAWIIEIPRPNIESLPVVIEHLNKAAYSIRGYQFEDAMANLRSAWNSFRPLINENWEKVAAEIDLDSPGEVGRDMKSQRIKNIKDSIVSFSQVGVHREYYKLHADDALLCYYQSISLISYLSKLLRRIENK